MEEPTSVQSLTLEDFVNIYAFYFVFLFVCFVLAIAAYPFKKVSLFFPALILVI